MIFWAVRCRDCSFLLCSWWTNDRNRIKTLRFLRHSIKICVDLNVKVAPAQSTKALWSPNWHVRSEKTHLPLVCLFFFFLSCLIWSLAVRICVASTNKEVTYLWNCFWFLKICCYSDSAVIRGTCLKMGFLRPDLIMHDLCIQRWTCNNTCVRCGFFWTTTRSNTPVNLSDSQSFGNIQDPALIPHSWIDSLKKKQKEKNIWNLCCKIPKLSGLSIETIRHN